MTFGNGSPKDFYCEDIRDILISWEYNASQWVLYIYIDDSNAILNTVAADWFRALELCVYFWWFTRMVLGAQHFTNALNNNIRLDLSVFSLADKKNMKWDDIFYASVCLLKCNPQRFKCWLRFNYLFTWIFCLCKHWVIHLTKTKCGKWKWENLQSLSPVRMGKKVLLCTDRWWYLI